MKITKTEGIWLIITTILYIAYNFTGVPPYNQPTATLIHAAVTVVPSGSSPTSSSRRSIASTS